MTLTPASASCHPPEATSPSAHLALRRGVRMQAHAAGTRASDVMTPLPPAGRRDTSSFLSLKKFADVCRVLELSDALTILPKDGKRGPRRAGCRDSTVPGPTPIPWGAERQG